MELINPTNNLVERVKLRPDSTGCFYGQIQLDDELGEGDYVLRAYTRFMQNIGEDYFFTKQVYITNPISEKVFVDIKYLASGNMINSAIYQKSREGKDCTTTMRCLSWRKCSGKCKSSFV